ncbi:MAG: hypothetical protein PVJ57_05260 [Phycisphaerae bacterium]|jgi:hypothetical protein
MATHTKHESGRGFLNDTPAVIARVKDAFADVVRGLPKDIERANELSKTLGVSTKLGWQVTRLLYESDPFVAAQYVPGQNSVKKFLAAAAGLNVDASVIAAAERAIEEFDRLVQTHADNRESFDMLAAGCAARVVESSYLDYRKAAFVGSSFTWGVHARVQLATAFVFPAEDQTRFNVLSVRGFVELRRLRPSVSWPIQTSHLLRADGGNEPTMNRTPLDVIDEADPVAGVPLLREFSTHPLSEVRRVFAPNDIIRDELVGGEIGKQGVVNCLLGEVIWNLPGRYRSEQNREWGVGAKVRTPCEVVILDQFVHRDLFGPVSPRPKVFSDLTETASLYVDQRADDRMDLFQRVEFLGRGLSGIRTPEMPDYVDLASYVMKRVGLDSEMFEAYRVRIEYPPMPISVMMLLDLPAEPGTR